MELELAAAAECEEAAIALDVAGGNEDEGVAEGDADDDAGGVVDAGDDEAGGEGEGEEEAALDVDATEDEFGEVVLEGVSVVEAGVDVG